MVIPQSTFCFWWQPPPHVHNAQAQRETVDEESLGHPGPRWGRKLRQQWWPGLVWAAGWGPDKGVRSLTTAGSLRSFPLLFERAVPHQL